MTKTVEALMTDQLPFVYLSLLPKYSHQRAAAIKTVADLRGISTSTVARKLKRFIETEGVAKPPTQPARSTLHKKNRGKPGEALRLRRKRVTPEKIARRLRVSTATIYRWLAKARKEGRI